MIREEIFLSVECIVIWLIRNGMNMESGLMPTIEKSRSKIFTVDIDALAQSDPDQLVKISGEIQKRLDDMTESVMGDLLGIEPKYLANQIFHDSSSNRASLSRFSAGQLESFLDYANLQRRYWMMEVALEGGKHASSRDQVGLWSKVLEDVRLDMAEKNRKLS